MRRVHCQGYPWVATLVVAFLVSLAPFGSGAEPQEVKIVAQGSFVDSFHPISVRKAETLVVRNVEELVAVSAQGRQAKDPAAAQKNPDIQKEVEKQLASALKVEKIDWEKQMVVVVSTDSGADRRVNPKVELVSLKVDGKKLTLTLAQGGIHGSYGRCPGVVALVERHDGKAEVEWKREK